MNELKALRELGDEERMEQRYKRLTGVGAYLEH